MSRQDLITLGEGDTPLLKEEGIYLKCEFKNPTGSHKDRAFARQISEIKSKGIKMAVISSSGNSAISAAHYCKIAGIELCVFVSKNINKNKLKIIESLKCHIFHDPKPVSASIKFAKENNIYNLRQSTDPNAASGYEPIVAEIEKAGISADGIFIPVSSGTTLVGIASGFAKSGHNVPIHAVQTDVIHPISGVFDRDYSEAKGKSFADAIVARYTPREDECVRIIRNTNGWGWVTGNDDMEKGRAWLLKYGINCSYEGAATIAALWKAKKNGFNFINPVCLLTGKFYG